MTDKSQERKRYEWFDKYCLWVIIVIALTFRVINTDWAWAIFLLGISGFGFWYSTYEPPKE